jgi:hypothetical protein
MTYGTQNSGKQKHYISKFFRSIYRRELAWHITQLKANEFTIFYFICACMKVYASKVVTKSLKIFIEFKREERNVIFWSNFLTHQPLNVPLILFWHITLILLHHLLDELLPFKGDRCCGNLTFELATNSCYNTYPQIPWQTWQREKGKNRNHTYGLDSK